MIQLCVLPFCLLCTEGERDDERRRRSRSRSLCRRKNVTHKNISLTKCSLESGCHMLTRPNTLSTQSDTHTNQALKTDIIPTKKQKSTHEINRQDIHPNDHIYTLSADVTHTLLRVPFVSSCLCNPPPTFPPVCG